MGKGVSQCPHNVKHLQSKEADAPNTQVRGPPYVFFVVRYVQLHEHVFECTGQIHTFSSSSVMFHVFILSTHRHLLKAYLCICLKQFSADTDSVQSIQFNTETFHRHSYVGRASIKGTLKAFI